MRPNPVAWPTEPWCARTCEVQLRHVSCALANNSQPLARCRAVVGFVCRTMPANRARTTPILTLASRARTTLTFKARALTTTTSPTGTWHAVTASSNGGMCSAKTSCVFEPFGAARPADSCESVCITIALAPCSSQDGYLNLAVNVVQVSGNDTNHPNADAGRSPNIAYQPCRGACVGHVTTIATVLL